MRCCAMVVRRHSRLSKSVPIENQYATSCCNYVPILYRFRDITIYWWKISGFHRFSPVSFEALGRRLVLRSRVWVGVKKLHDSENHVTLWAFVCAGYQLVTDRHTDRQTAPPMHSRAVASARQKASHCSLQVHSVMWCRYDCTTFAARAGPPPISSV